MKYTTDITYYVACSIDGFIADELGGVEWLGSVEKEGEDYGYSDFIDSNDALVMGSRTYEQVLSFGEWPYGTKPCWVMSKRPLAAVQPSVRITSDEPKAVVSEIDRSGHLRVWLVGGSVTAGEFLEQGLISHFIISFIPVILGGGIPLFGGSPRIRELVLERSERFQTGVVQLFYSANRPEE